MRGVSMSYVDELRNPKEKPRYTEDYILRQCEFGIKHSCEKAQRNRKHKIKGELMFHHHDEDDGPCICESPNGEHFFDSDEIDFDTLKNKIEQLIISLGFTKYNVKILTRACKDYSRPTIFGGPRKRTGYVIYLELKW